MGAGRIAGVAGAIAAVAIGAFLLLSSGTPSPRSAPGPAAARPGSAEHAPDAAAAGVAPIAPVAPDVPAAPVPTALAGSGSITGRLVWTSDRGTGAPGVLIVLGRGPEGSNDEAGRTRSDPEGRFTFAGLAAGEHSFSTLAGEGEMWDHEHETVAVEEGKTSEVELWVEKPLPPGTGIRVTGTVKYEDGRPAGRFRFTLDHDDDDHRVEAENGLWERRLPTAGKYRVWGVRADGQDFNDPEIEFDAEEGRSLDIVLPLPKDAVLVVVARGSGEPLPTARVYRKATERRDWLFDYHPNPATLQGEPLRADAAGRVSLGPGTQTETVCVVADGYAWRQTEAEHAGDAPTRIALEPGGTLRLAVTGWDALQEATVCLHRHEPWARWTLPNPPAGGQATYTGIAAGAWTVVIRRGMDHEDGEIYGEAEATVAAGAETDVSIVARTPAARTPVGVIGTVTFPAGWDREETTLEFEGAEPGNVDVERSADILVGARGMPVPFVLKPLPPGRYHVTLEPQFRETVTVPEKGGVFHFKMPPAGTLIVRALDDATGEPIVGGDCWWHVPSGRQSYSSDYVRKAEGPGRWRIVAPAGSVRIRVSAPGYVDEYVGEPGPGVDDDDGRTGVAVAAGSETTLTVRMKRAGGLRVVFRFEGHPPEWDEMEAYLSRSGPAGEEAWEFMDVKKGMATTDEALPGDWDLNVRDLGEQFEEVSPRRVTVVAGETATVEITLVRKR